MVMQDIFILGGVVAVGTFLMLFLFALVALYVNKIGGRRSGMSKLLIIGFSLLNAVYNMTLGTVLMLDPIKRLGEPTTERLKRYKKKYSANSTGLDKWRWTIAETVGAWLNKFDPGHY